MNKFEEKIKTNSCNYQENNQHNLLIGTVKEQRTMDFKFDILENLKIIMIQVFMLNKAYRIRLSKRPRDKIIVLNLILGNEVANIISTYAPEVELNNKIKILFQLNLKEIIIPMT